MALLPSTLLYITLPWLCFIQLYINYSTQALFTPLCSTILHHGSSYFTLLYSILLCHGYTSLYFNQHYTTMAQPHSTLLYITLSWLHFILLHSTSLYITIAVLHSYLPYNTLPWVCPPHTTLHYTTMALLLSSLHYTNMVLLHST